MLPLSPQRLARFRALALLACFWPTSAFVALWIWRFGIGGIAFKFLPVVIAGAVAFRWQLREPMWRAASLVAETAVSQLVLMLLLELASLAVLSSGTDAQRLAAIGVVSTVTWAMHTVVGLKTAKALGIHGWRTGGRSSNPK